MPDQPRPWPNNALHARDDSAEAAAEGVRLLEPLVMGKQEFSETERLRRDAGALNLFQKILRLLESVGACTRP